jgi:AraC-like DNA-binding protein
MLATLTLFLIGFSLGSALLLIAANLSGYGTAAHGAFARTAGIVLLLALAALQWLHGAYLLRGDALFASALYAALLYVAAAAFYLFFVEVLQPPAAMKPWRLLHFLPALLAVSVPPRLAIPLAFLFGTVHALLLLRVVYRLRAQRRHFRVEASAFTGFALIAALVLVLGLGATWFGERVFFLGYAQLIGLAFWLALWLLLCFPDLPGRAAEAVRSAYANSTLARIDKDEALQRLRHLLTREKVYTDENLSLSGLAELMALTPHQLSELINTAYGVGFSRHVREHRVEAAKRLLLAEPEASVLSIGLAVGFNSQSNFYAAFREITGEVPGRYRKRSSAPDS